MAPEAPFHERSMRPIRPWAVRAVGALGGVLAGEPLGPVPVALVAETRYQRWRPGVSADSTKRQRFETHEIGPVTSVKLAPLSEPSTT